MSFIEYLEENFDCKEVTGGSEIQVADGPCPFCGASSRGDLRMYVNADEEIDVGEPSGFCHHHGGGFSALSFVKAAEGCSIKEARKILGGDEDQFRKAPKERQTEEQEERICPFPPTISLYEHQPALDYAYSRGITDEMIRHFHMLYCHTDFIFEGRVVYASNRIIFPVKKTTREILAWQGRDITGRKKVKYLTPPGYQKSKYLYNCHALRPGVPVILCEGVMDVIGWHKAGFQNVVATFGKTISQEQLAILCSYKPPKLYMAWDSDALREREVFVRKNRHLFPDVSMVDLGGHDADELDAYSLMSAYERAAPYSWEEHVLAML